MADLILGSTTAISESGGTVTIDNAVQDNITRLGTVTSGNINTGFKIHTVSFTGDSGANSQDPYIWGTALAISSADNPNGAKFLVNCGGGRWDGGTLITAGAYFMEGASPSWTSSSGTKTDIVIGPCAESVGWKSGVQNYIGMYENDTGGATPVEFKIGFESTSGNARLYSNDSTHARFGITAYRMY